MGLSREQRQANERKREKLLELLRNGVGLHDAVSQINIHRTTYYRWREENPAWAKSVNALLEAQGAKVTDVGVPDFATFCAKYLKQPVYPHQQNWIDLLEGKTLKNLHPSIIYEQGEPNLILVNTPPEHAKSTTISINYVTWRIVRDPNVKIILASKTQDMAKDFLFAIKTRLSHPRYAELQKAFGPPDGYKADSTVWASDQIIIGSQRDSGEKDPTVQAIGIGGQLYGSRADLIVLDDGIVIANAHEFEKQLRWIQQELITRLGPFGIAAIVGTRVDAIDLYRELRNPDRYAEGVSPWTYLAQPAVLEYAEEPANWVTLWPRSQEPWPGQRNAKAGPDGLYSHWDGLHLAKRRNLINPRSWALAYQQADVEEDAVFDPVKVKACMSARSCGPLVKELSGRGMEGLYVIGSMDPAMVGDTGVIVLAVDRHSKKRWILDAKVRTGATPAWIRQIIKELTEHYHIHEWRIERNAFQQFLTQDPELNEWLGSRGVRLSEHVTGKNKWDVDFGIASMALLFNLQLIDMPSAAKTEAIKALIEQLITWSPETKAKTDMVMSLWFAEIRAREVCQAVSFDGDGPRAYQPNRWLSKRQKAQQVVINLNDLAAHRARQIAHR